MVLDGKPLADNVFFSVVHTPGAELMRCSMRDSLTQGENGQKFPAGKLFS